MNDPVRIIKGEALNALVKFDRRSTKPALPKLLELLKDSSPGVRGVAAEAIRRIDSETAEVRKTEIDAALAPDRQ